MLKSDVPDGDVCCEWNWITGKLIRYDKPKRKTRNEKSSTQPYDAEEKTVDRIQGRGIICAFATEIIDKELDNNKLRADSCCVICICCPESFSRLSDDDLVAVTSITVSIAAVVVVVVVVVVDILLPGEAITVLAWLTCNI
uniref:Uncharacterized protein n=1 Tax=Glossina palpalis gambiensis TaxID=67801 RepID=A0A1B0ASY0_9MUSC